MDIGQILEVALSTAIGPQGAAFAIAAIGLNVHFGYTGLLNFGHVGFFLVSAYGAAITVDRGGPLWLGVVVGLVAAAVLAVLLGIPTLRLRADYLAIVTIAIAEILRLVVASRWASPVTGGAVGLKQVAVDFRDVNPIPDGTYGVGGLLFTERVLWVMVVGWALAALATVLVWSLFRSPWGRVMQAIREDEDAARSLGKNVFSFKMQSLVLGGVLGGLAGTVLMFNSISVAPNIYVAERTFFIYVIVILGGAGTILGPVAGTLVFWFLLEFSDGLLAGALDEGWISDSFLDRQDLAAVRFVLVGAGLIALMVFRPQGLFGSRDRLLMEES